MAFTNCRRDDLPEDMVDDNDIKPTQMKKGTKRERGSKMVVIIQHEKPKSTTQLEVEPDPTIPCMVDEIIAIPTSSTLVGTIAITPPHSIVHLQHATHRHSGGT